MARISMLTPEQLDPELRQRSRADERTPLELGLTRILGHQPEMAKGLGQFTSSLKVNRTLPERLIELVRLRVAFHNQCRSCMAIRYPEALADGLTEDMVCSLERPMEAEDLDDRERLAIRYGELFATNHLAIDDEFYDRMRELFTEPEIVELGLNVALCVGIGRLSATWDMVDELPDRYRAEGEVTPWGGDDAIVVESRR
jgi:AhpD family alkylhydroperoxidase